MDQRVHRLAEEFMGRFPSCKTFAQKAMDNSYSPYSKFQVGAAILVGDKTLSDISIVAGTNVENASYGLTCCAERSAIFSAVSSGILGPGKYIHGVVVVTSGESDRPTGPCGACRQVIYEFSLPTTLVVSVTPSHVASWSIDQLLPGAFGPADLGMFRVIAK